MCAYIYTFLIKPPYLLHLIVHGTAMNNTNTLTSGDNRGYASYLLEQHINGKDVCSMSTCIFIVILLSHIVIITINTTHHHIPYAIQNP
ncbi:hypothetical protein EON63_21440 [archaeon]|nr:MAG: hypothetical protein EON63_21440 [archaeon]